jgi:hypothetical protein
MKLEKVRLALSALLVIVALLAAPGAPAANAAGPAPAAPGVDSPSPDISININPNPVTSPGTTVVFITAHARAKGITSSYLNGMLFQRVTQITARICANTTYTLDVYFADGGHVTKTATAIVTGQCIQ